MHKANKNIFILLICTMLFALCFLCIYALPYVKGDDVNVMIYMCASDLETDESAATSDIDEILAADLPQNVHVYIETGGTLEWHGYGISSERTEIYSVENKQLILADNTLEQLDMTAPETLQNFIEWCSKKSPSGRNILIFWGHGGGPVEGFGYDEFAGREATLSLDEIKVALANAGTKFNTIGFDTCLMGSLETAYVLREYSDYMLASEDFESGCGWDYTISLNALSNNTSISETELGLAAAQGFIKQSRADKADGVLALIDLAHIEKTYTAWKNFAYVTPRATLVPRMTKPKANSGTMKYELGTDMITCGMADMLEAARDSDTKEAKALINAAQKSIVVFAATESSKHLCGLSVSLPYLSPQFSEKQQAVYSACGFDDEYLNWLKGFTPHTVNISA